jgi:mediator of RNA polymerase II transcription subunit 14
MQEEVNMTVDDRAGEHHMPNGVTANGIIKAEMTPDLLENELPFVYDGQISLGELLSRVMQMSYNELAELAET